MNGLEKTDRSTASPSGVPKGGHGIGRREVLLAGAALAVAPAWAAAERRAGVAETTDAAREVALSVGYLYGSDVLDRPRWPLDEGALLRVGTPLLVVPATNLDAGDPRLEEVPAVLRVQGFYPDGLPASELPEGIGLDIVFRNDKGVDVPFHAWAYGRGSGAAPPVRFLRTVAQEDPLVVELEAHCRPRPHVGSEGEGGADAQRRQPPPCPRQRARFTLGSENGRPRLRTGIYFLGVGEGIWDVERTLPEAAAGLLSIVLTVEAAPVGEP